jgi:hypothetical protein
MDASGCGGAAVTLSVVCCKWRDPTYRWNDLYAYDGRCVNVMASMLRRNLHQPHKLVCFTDDPTGIDTAAVEVHPIWDDVADLGHCYRKLKLFTGEPWLRDIVGERFLYIDLDAVIVSQIGDLLAIADDFDFMAYQNISTWTRHYCGAMWMLRTGAFPQVWERFNDPAVRRCINLNAKHWFGSDQVWIGIEMGPGWPQWTNEHGVWHFKQEIFGKPLPSNARIVLFNGAVSPWMPDLQESHPWIKEYWR